VIPFVICSPYPDLCHFFFGEGEVFALYLDQISAQIEGKSIWVYLYKACCWLYSFKRAVFKKKGHVWVRSVRPWKPLRHPVVGGNGLPVLAVYIFEFFPMPLWDTLQQKRKMPESCEMRFYPYKRT
jgi:hypothetical protein